MRYLRMILTRRRKNQLLFLSSLPPSSEKEIQTVHLRVLLAIFPTVEARKKAKA